MLIPYILTAIGTATATILGSGFSAGGFIAAPFVASFCVLATALISGWFDPKERNERAIRAELARQEERRQRIMQIFAERAGRYEPTVIEGEFTVLNNLRKSGAL